MKGFASMTPERRREVGRRGGLAARGKAHRWTSEEAAAAGKKGALASLLAKKRKVSGGN